MNKKVDWEYVASVETAITEKYAKKRNFKPNLKWQVTNINR